jgi:MFS superfamily sulfate permease-like transporter
LLLAVLGIFVLIIFYFVASTGTNNRGSTSRNYFSSSKSNANGLFATVVIIVLVCASVGMFVGIILSVMILRNIMKHHTSKLWLRQEAEKYVVKDFQRRRQELEKYKKSS